MSQFKKGLRLILCFSLLFFFVHPSKAQLYNPDSTAAGNKATLLKFLHDVYGKKIISGQMDDKYLSYIIETTGGISPAMMGYDFNGICPSQGGNNDAQKAIDWVKNKGGIAQFQWHWISPNADGDFYSSNFKLGEALKDTNSISYKNMIRDIDLVAGAMKKMKDAGVPILWRPLHEAEGKWFWWGYSGGDACKKLYRLMYDRMVNKFKLDNLIWIWNSYGTTKENWYPGDDVADIIAWDYPDYNNSTGSWSQYNELFGQKGKMFGIGEDGKLNDPAVLTTQGWLYFLTWAYMVQDPSVKDGKNPKEWLMQVYNDPRVITLDDLNPGAKAKGGFSEILFDFDGNGNERVTLDGSNSSTDKGTIEKYVWTENDIEIATGSKTEIALGIGIHLIKLTVTTSTGEVKSCFVYKTIKQPSLTLNKSVSVSSSESGGNIASNTVDGNFSTRWSSAYAEPQWLQVNLGNKYDIQRLLINWQNSSAKEYSIQQSNDGINWSTLITKTDMKSGARIDTLNNLGGSGQFIRINLIKRSTNFGFSIFEFEAYGTKSVTTGFYQPTQKNLRIYPTIIQESENLKVECSADYRNSQYFICNQLGRIFKIGTLKEEFTLINIDKTYHSGFYFFHLQSRDTSQTIKFIIRN